MITKYILLKPFFFLSILLATIVSCHKIPVGFLTIDYASYQEDSMVIKFEIDTTPPILTPNPLFDLYLSMGYPKEYLISYGILPFNEEGGGAEYHRNRRGEPWTSTPIEGIEGTMPIRVSVGKVVTSDGDPEKLKQYIQTRGNGVLTVPLNHQIPRGRYLISLEFKNEGYTKSLTDIFTLIVL